MLYNSAKARDRFPRLLEILAKNKNEETKETFTSSVSRVPSWMFLPWLAQILGSMNQPYEAGMVLPILNQVAKSYPQAIYYPFKITSESLSEAALKLVKQIAAELSKNTLLDTFVASLDKLTQPEHRFKDTMESLKPLMRASKRDTSKIKTIVRQLYEDVLDNSPNAGSYSKQPKHTCIIY
jgi:DNA-dependent protein kinase catalytic subunit